MDVPKSFFIFCSGEDFATRLSVPKGFVECHGLNYRREVSLRLKTQPAATSWDVQIKKIDGGFYIADGWSEFVRDNGLLEMKLLVFYIVGDSTLHVSIFSHDSCLELPARTPTSKAKAKKPSSMAWRVVKKFKEYHFLDMKLRIPKDMAAAAGIGKKGKIDMKDWKGRKWAISITQGGKGSFAFSGKWESFVKANKLVCGDILLLEFGALSSSVNVKLVEPQAGEKMLSRANYGGFLP